jgi:hypothetical protein
VKRSGIASKRGEERATARRTSARSGTERLTKLREDRSKLLALHYEGHISAEQFGEEQARITTEIETLEADTTARPSPSSKPTTSPSSSNSSPPCSIRSTSTTCGTHATEAEKRTLLDELLDRSPCDDRLVVAVHGAPALNVAFSEVGLKDSQIGGVGGGT